MPGPMMLAKRLPWVRVWLTARWMYERGRKHLYENLDVKERSEFLELMKNSKGRPANLSKRQKDRLRDLVMKSARGQ